MNKLHVEYLIQLTKFWCNVIFMCLLCRLLGKMAGQFRSSQWDPVLIIAQIITMQCLFYVGLGSCVAVIDFILGSGRSLSHLFVYQVNSTSQRTSVHSIFWLCGHVVAKET